MPSFSLAEPSLTPHPSHHSWLDLGQGIQQLRDLRDQICETVRFRFDEYNRDRIFRKVLLKG